MKVIEFVLNKSAMIVVDPEIALNEMHCCHNASIFFVCGNERYLLSIDSLRDNMYVLISLLKKALARQLQLHFSIDEDIGYLFNQDLQDKPGLTCTKLDKRDYWVGNSYLIWNNDLATWLYNADGDSAITFLITPIYPGNWNDAYPVTYEEWIKNYAPLFVATLTREIAQSWLIQAQEIYDHIECNMQRLGIKK